MSDLHALPLVGRDLPDYSTGEHNCPRPRVFAKRTETGHRNWYWTIRASDLNSLSAVHGPFWTVSDAHKSAEDWVMDL
jgi:hypothetical protein